MDKQEVEIRQGMTAAALAEAMNRDFGKDDRQYTGGRSYLMFPIGR